MLKRNDMSSQHYTIVALPGDGIGPEVTHEAMQVLEAAAAAFGFGVAVQPMAMGGAAIDAEGTPLPEATLDACLTADAVFLGAVGGPRWDALTGDFRPESGLLKLRKALGAFANLRPVQVPDALVDASPLKPDRVAGVDLLVVRELTGGIYFGKPKGEVDGVGWNTMRYTEAEIERVARVAFEWARRRGGRVTSVDKANVLAVSQLWRRTVTRLHEAAFADVTLDHLYVDNAAMQLVRAPGAFDVILTANLFGDILSDLAATLPGSLGLLPSASIGGKVGLFEPVHGSAPDIAGQDKANPIAAILSVAMMLDHLGESLAATAIRQAVDDTLARGFRSADLAGAIEPVGTRAFGAAICDALSTTAPSFTV